MCKRITEKAATIVNPEFNGLGLQAFAYGCIAFAFNDSRQTENAIRMAKKFRARMLKSLGGGRVPRLQCDATPLLLALPRTEVLNFLRPLITHVTVKPSCCSSSSSCSSRRATEYLPLSMPLEVLLATLPTCVTPAERFAWYTGHLERSISYPMAEKHCADVATMWKEASIPALIIGLIDKYLGRSDFAVAPNHQLCKVLVPVAVLYDLQTSGSEKNDSRHLTLEVLAKKVEPYLAEVGLGITLLQIVKNYSALDKNMARKTPDRELLPLLGIQA
eukprot:m.293915 g.293915  ORF g.293915 m.293915 type:complete len:275 (+) comp34897_c0_seq1:308-1132(+)